MAVPGSDRAAEKRVVPAREANQGESTGRIRLVLHASLALAVIAGIILYAIYFL